MAMSIKPTTPLSRTLHFKVPLSTLIVPQYLLDLGYKSKLIGHIPGLLKEVPPYFENLIFELYRDRECTEGHLRAYPIGIHLGYAHELIEIHLSRRRDGTKRVWPERKRVELRWPQLLPQAQPILKSQVATGECLLVDDWVPHTTNRWRGACHLVKEIVAFEIRFHKDYFSEGRIIDFEYWEETWDQKLDAWAWTTRKARSEKKKARKRSQSAAGRGVLVTATSLASNAGGKSKT